MNAETISYINTFYPVSRAKIYPNGTVILCRARTVKKVTPQQTRGQVKRFSTQSLSRVIFLASETLVTFKSMLTLTYGLSVPTSGIVAKRHLHLMLMKIRYHYGQFDYLWWLEFQKRGAIHYHILLTIPAEENTRLLFSKLWVQAVGEYATPKMIKVHNHKKAFEEIRKHDNGTSYLTWYATKKGQKTVPKMFTDIGRFWGNSRAVKETIPDPVIVSMEDEHVRLLYPRLANLPILPKIIYA